MARISRLAVSLALCAEALICAVQERSGARVPVLLELFTSEGCSSCPPADRLLEALDQKQPVAGADLIVLSEHVDYWDRLGWRDPFSSPQYSERQKEYASSFHREGVYTPQLVIDGRFELVGSDGRQAASAIQKSIRERKIPIAISSHSRSGDQLRVNINLPSEGQMTNSGRGVLYIAITDNRAESHVTRGENAGRNLDHVGVTRVLKQAGTLFLGSASTREVVISLQPGIGTRGSRLIVFVQDPRSGHILAVAAQKL